MGWWRVVNEGISLEKTELYNGDEPADILGAALGEVIEEYKKQWGREPYKEELTALLNFVTNPLGLKDSNAL